MQGGSPLLQMSGHSIQGDRSRTAPAVPKVEMVALLFSRENQGKRTAGAMQMGERRRGDSITRNPLRESQSRQSTSQPIFDPENKLYRAIGPRTEARRIHGWPLLMEAPWREKLWSTQNHWSRRDRRALTMVQIRKSHRNRRATDELRIFWWIARLTIPRLRDFSLRR
jgi:hypothetical protein